MPAAPVFWLDALPADLVLSGSDVAQMTDVGAAFGGSGGNDAPQATPSRRPTYNASNALFGNTPTIDFTDAVTFRFLTTANVAIAQPYSVIVACSVTTVTAGSYVLSSSTSARCQLRVGATDASGRSFTRLSAGTPVADYLGPDAQRLAYVGAVYNGASSFLVFGASRQICHLASGSVGSGRYEPATLIGKLGSGEQGFIGSISFLGVFGVALALGDVVSAFRAGGRRMGMPDVFGRVAL